MVRSLRAGLDQYMDPDLKQRMQAAAVDKAPSNTMQGLGFLLRKAMLGYDMGQDKKQRTAVSGALTTGSENQTKIIDAIKAQKAVEARPAMGKVSNQELYEMDAAPGGVNANRELYEQDGGWSNFEDAAPAMAAREASPEIKAQMARIDPNSGALYGTSQALAELLRTDPNNPYAQGALLDNAGQLSNRNANLQLNQLNNQNKLATIANTRAYQAKLTEVKRRNELADAETEFGRKQQLERDKYRMPKTVNTATGIHILNPDGSLGKRIGAIPPGRGTQPLTPERFKQNKQLHTMRVNAAAAAKIATEAELKRIKPLPASVVKKQDELLEQADIADNIDEDLGTIHTQLTDGSLELGLLTNKAYELRNYTGNSNEESTLYSNMRTKLEKLRNDSLRLNNGVQTEGDATRAWDEILANMNDTNIVKTRLAEIRRLNQRAKEELYFRVTTIRNEYGKKPLRRKKQGDIPVGWTEVN